MIIQIQLLQFALCNIPTGTGTQRFEQAMLAYPVHLVAQGIHIAGTEYFQRIAPLTNHIVHIGARQRRSHFRMLIHELFHSLQITFLHGYGTTLQRRSVGHVERSSHAAHIAADRTIGGAGIRERET